MQGGFTLDESIRVLQWLGGAGIDLLEISDGTWEQLEFLKAPDPAQILGSTRQREAMFMKYAGSIKAAASLPEPEERRVLGTCARTSPGPRLERGRYLFEPTTTRHALQLRKRPQDLNAKRQPGF